MITRKRRPFAILPLVLPLLLPLLSAALLAAVQNASAEVDKPPLPGILGEVFVLLDERTPVPDQSFVAVEAGDPRKITLDAFRGRVVLLNFWATWCAPCVREMPALDRLQAKMSPEGVSVVAVSTDRKGLAQVAPFYEELQLAHLDIYLDSRSRLSRAFGVRGLPTTMVIDGAGRIVGGVEGPLEWDGPEVEVLLRHLLDELDHPVELHKTGG
jgi:thiol-disulfide isomerase/thioredoxin